MRTILCITMILAGLILIAVGCTDPEQVALARMRQADAEARRDVAPAVIIEAQTNAAMTKLRALTDINKEMRDYDAGKARSDFATIVLEFQTLNLAIRGETEAAREATAALRAVTKDAEPIGHNALAAARNSWFTNIGLCILGFGLVGSTLLMMHSFNKLNKGD